MPNPSSSDLVGEARQLAARKTTFTNTLDDLERAKALLPELAQQLEQAEQRNERMTTVLLEEGLLFPTERASEEWFEKYLAANPEVRADEGADPAWPLSGGSAPTATRPTPRCSGSVSGARDGGLTFDDRDR